MSPSLPRALCLFLLLGCPLVTGCTGSSGGVVVKGKVLKGGQPIKVTDKGMVQIRFINEKNSYLGQVGADGSYTITGSDGKGVPPGSYKGAVLAVAPYHTKDLLGGKFNDQRTTLSREIKAGQEVVIDVDKP